MLLAWLSACPWLRLLLAELYIDGCNGWTVGSCFSLLSSWLEIDGKERLVIADTWHRGSFVPAIERERERACVYSS